MVQGRLIALALAAAALNTLGAHADPLDVEIGKALFERNWVAAPSSTGSDDGLGPLYDARSCNACHAGGGPGQAGAVGEGSLVRIGNARGIGDPVYGVQFQVSALRGVPPEGSADVSRRSENGLRVFQLSGRHLGYGAMATDSRVALRRAPSLRGIALLESIPDAQLRSRADPNDRNRDGVSGRAGLGRFGWKATQATIAGQASVAFMRDLGLSTPGRREPWGECTAAETACRAGPHGARPGEVEVPGKLRDMVVAYLKSLPAPEPLNTNAGGYAIFIATGCAECHVTPRGRSRTPVRAYTDLLLHDMGRGLDDGIAEGNARPSEWRTAPLWDIPEEIARGGLLHDGRARDVSEAIAWHGGEGSHARANFDALSAPDKAAIVAFLMGK